MKQEIRLLAGVRQPNRERWKSFDARACAFVVALGAALRKSALWQDEAVAALSFWCRAGHIDALAKQYPHRRGQGLIFHLAPANVPTQFAYSLVISLLAGNSNLVRLSTRADEVQLALCAEIEQLLQEPRFQALRARTGIVTYPHEEEMTAQILQDCDGRIVWGGDAAVAAMQAIAMPQGAAELFFSDRWSLSVLSEQSVAALEEDACRALAHRFYNDAYLMDQNACASPRLVLWLEDGAQAARERFWDMLAQEAAQQYPLSPYHATQKYAQLCQSAILHPEIKQCKQYGGNGVFVLQIDAALPRYEARFGLFYERGVATLDALVPELDARAQTISCFGVDVEVLQAFLTQHNPNGINRVVPIGSALHMDVQWEGIDMIHALSQEESYVVF